MHSPWNNASSEMAPLCKSMLGPWPLFLAQRDSSWLARNDVPLAQRLWGLWQLVCAKCTLRRDCTVHQAGHQCCPMLVSYIKFHLHQEQSRRAGALQSVSDATSCHSMAAGHVPDCQQNPVHESHSPSFMTQAPFLRVYLNFDAGTEVLAKAAKGWRCMG